MNSIELGRVGDIFKENWNRSGCNSNLDPQRDVIAMIATIVDLVRKEIKSMQPIAKEEEKEIPIVPLSVLERTEPILYLALFAIGCERLNDITGYREHISEKYTKVIEVMIKGRFAALSGKIGSGDMMTLSRLMRENGLPSLVRWSE